MPVVPQYVSTMVGTGKLNALKNIEPPLTKHSTRLGEMLLSIQVISENTLGVIMTDLKVILMRLQELKIMLNLLTNLQKKLVNIHIIILDQQRTLRMGMQRCLVKRIATRRFSD